ncbi:NACHT domain protein [Truncatella angustata]|uniref:NACHT domain protein n=1 Tax=Truncatella angustata TaxID=152316 RepID=A0A9P8UVC2_9PEZI|nr:NACHT domain protein [Truncatella angustata]KAH6658883.1 NACHT domain protein [Truncatella angustata]
MAPAALVSSGVPAMASSYMSSEGRSFSRHALGMQDSRFPMNNGGLRVVSGRHAMRSSSTVDNSAISNLVYSLKRRSSNELGSNASARLLNETYDSIRDWIAAQRMSHLPPEGSSYDKVLTWTQLFVERIDSFDLAIQEFSGDSYLAAQLAYGYCAMLLDLGNENAPALMISFGFFYGISMSLVNLLERTELFGVSQNTREQLVLAMSDLVTLVASVASYFHKAIHDASTTSVSVNIYSTFSNQIKVFNDRCERIAALMWQHQLLVENLSTEEASDIKSVEAWIAPEDRALTNVAVGLSLLAHDREELTCLWVGPYLTRFLKSQDTVLSIHGKAGSGKSIVASVIVDYLQRPISGVHYNALFIPINSRISAETSSRAIAKAIMCQLFEKRIGNVELLHILYDAYQRSNLATSNEDYDNIVWSALERALAAASPGARELIIVVDGIDEASCGEKVMFERLNKATAHGSNVKLIVLGTERHPRSVGLSDVQINDDLIFDDIVAVVRSHFDSDNEFSTMSEFEQESIITRISEASDGSFLWAKLATKRLRREVGLDKFRHAVDAVVKAKPSITDFVLRNLQSSSMTEDARLMLMWLSIAQRPISPRELGSLLSIQLDQGTVLEKSSDVLATLRPAQNLVFLQDGLLYIRHGMIRSSLHELVVRGQLVSTVKDAHADLVSRLLLSIRSAVNEQRKPTIGVLDHNETSQFLHKYQLLDFAVRHWPYHLTQTTVFKKEGSSAAAKAFSRFYPTSTTAILLQASLWEHRPKPLLLAYQAIVTDVYRHLFGTKSPLTLQSVIFLAILHRQVNMTDKAAVLFFEAAIMSKKLLGAGDSLTMQMADWFIELTNSNVTASRTDMMTKREEVLTILVECYKSQFGTTSTKVVTILRQLAEHYQMTKEEQKIKQINLSINSITAAGPEGILVEGEHDLQVQLKQRRDSTESSSEVSLHLDVKEQDEMIESIETLDLDLGMKRIESAISEHKMDVADRVYVEVWQRTSREYREHRSESCAETHLKAALGYAKFLHNQKRPAEASATLISTWEDMHHGSVAFTEASISVLLQIGRVLKSLGNLTEALAVFKHCSQHSADASVSKDVQQIMHATSQEVLKSAGASHITTFETTLEEMLLESSSSFTSMDQTTFAATKSLATLFFSQHRWVDATHFLKRVLRGIWPSLFSASVQDVCIPRQDVESCVELAGRLAECYRTRRRQSKEEDIRVRVHRALRIGRKIDDKLREQSTSELLSFYDRTSQAEAIIAIREERLDDYTEHLGAEHPTVIKMLGDLAELTRPRPIFIEYYQRLIRIVNKDSDVSKAEVLQPVMIVAAELWSKGLFSDALPYYRVLFATFFKAPKTRSVFQDYDFVRESFDRYIQCLRSIRTSYPVLHDITTEYHARCKMLYGASASITIQAALSLARLCQQSESCEKQAVALYEELRKLDSVEIDQKEITIVLDRIQEEETALMISSSSNSMSTEQITRAVTVLQKQINKTREAQGWANEESLSRLTELIAFYNKQQQSDAVIRELQETTSRVLSTETSSVRLMAAASTIASNYLASNQVQKVTELRDEMYRQVFLKETGNIKQSHFDVSSRGREVLVFLAQLEFSLRRNSATLAETLAALNMQYVYFSEFNGLIRSNSSNFKDVASATARLHHYLLACGKHATAASVFDRFDKWFAEVEVKRTAFKAQPSPQTKLFLHSILNHFKDHKSNDMVRSVGIIGNAQADQLLKGRRYEEASDLALMCFTYVSAHKSYRTTKMTKLMLIMGMSIGGGMAKADTAARKKLLQTSQIIIQDVLRVMGELKINLAQMALKHLNQLIKLLGEQQDYTTLASLLTTLWNSREVQTDWPPNVTFVLARRFILARYMVGDTMAALRMTEHIVYNCRRVHGLRHPATLEMSILLSQLYSSIARKYQHGPGNGQDGSAGLGDMANRYYKKSAAIHESVLRVFSDPSYASVAGGALVDSCYSDRRASGSFIGGGSESPPPLLALAGDLFADGNQTDQSDGQRVRQHLHLLKLALERLGDYPKDYSEYEHLNADVFREFLEDLDGVEGVEKWNIKKFGGGKAEADDDLVKPDDIKIWEIVHDVVREDAEKEL